MRIPKRFALNELSELPDWGRELLPAYEPATPATSCPQVQKMATPNGAYSRRNACPNSCTVRKKASGTGWSSPV
jgi:hypothetical protein